MDEDLIHRWNKVVDSDDTVFVLGDVSLSIPALENVKLLNGHKILIPGNHDRNWAWHKKNKTLEQKTRNNKLYYDAGFEKIVQVQPDANGVLRDGTLWHFDNLVTATGGHQVILSHLPPSDDSHPEDRYTTKRPLPDPNLWYLHGHVHEAWRQRGKYINVGVDAWGGYPIPEATIIEVIGAGEQDLAPLPWHHSQ